MSSALALPPVHSYSRLESSPFRLADAGHISYPEERNELKQAAAWLAEQLSRKVGSWQPVAAKDQTALKPSIHLLPLSKTSGVPYPSSDKRFREAYRIEVGESLRIFAGGKAGAAYAAQRVLELLGERHQINAATIIDYPDYRWRGVIIRLGKKPCGQPQVLESNRQSEWLRCMDTVLDRFASMRLNLLVLISPIFHRLNEADLHLLAQLFEHARERNLEPMPSVASKLWGIPRSVLKVDAIEGIYHQQVPFNVQKGQLVNDTGNENLIPNGDFDLAGNAHWRLRSNPWGPSWKLAADKPGDESGNRYLSIRVPKSNDPWQSAAAPEDPVSGKLIPVMPGHYYELGVKLRSSKSRGGRLRVGVVDYDKNKGRIHNLHKYVFKIIGHEEWTKRWFPVFTSKHTRYLWIRFAPETLGDETVQFAIDDLELRSMQGRLNNVLVNRETRPVIMSEDAEVVYERGRDYVLESAPIKDRRDVAFADIEQLRIRTLPDSRMSDGETVKVSFDSLPLEYHYIPRSKYSVASEYTYNEYRRIFERLKRLSPVFVHIAMDEHMGGLNRDSRSLKLGMTNRNLLLSHINTLDSLMRSTENVVLPNGKYLPGVGAADTSLVMWDDMVNPWYNGAEPLYQVPFGGLPGETKLLAGDPKTMQLKHSIFLSSWWYPDEDKWGVVKNTPEYYHQAGYRFFATAWYQKGGILNWLKAINPRDAEGLLAATWGGKEGGVATIACVGWNKNAYEYCADL